MHRSGTIIRQRYQIERMLGRGGYGITYLTVDIDLPRHPKCVVKQLDIESENPDVLSAAREMFEREANVLERLGENHDQIPKLLAHFEENEEFYLVQEFIDGEDLSHEITPGTRLSEKKVIALLRDILEVLDFVHGQNVLHRDIKPSNLIRRSSDKKIVMIDFGVVKEISTLGASLEGNYSRTRPVGTSAYMPPEQENGNPRLSSDIYAVGIVAIQALTGLHPSNLEKDAFGKLMWRKHAPGVNNTLALVLDKMVHQNFKLRYQSAMETLNALNEASKSNRYKSLVHKLRRNPASVSLFILLPSLLPLYYIWSQTPNALITRNEMEELCKPSGINQLKKQNQNPSEFVLKGLVYDSLSSGKPAHRWRCRYENKNTSTVILLGLDIEKDICVKKYKNQGLTKVYPENLEDKNSKWFCIKPPAKRI